MVGVQGWIIWKGKDYKCEKEMDVVLPCTQFFFDVCLYMPYILTYFKPNGLTPFTNPPTWI